MKFIYIISPTSNKKIFLSHSNSSYEFRLNELKTKVFEEKGFKTYIENFYNKKNHNRFKKNAYDKLIFTLDNCGNYLLRGQYKKNGIMTVFNIRTSSVKEIPISSVSGNAEDLLYGFSSTNDSSDGIINSTAELSKYTYEDHNNIEDNRDGKRKQKRLFQIHKRYTQSNTYKLTKLYSTHEVGETDYYRDGYDYNGKRINCNGSFPYKHKEMKDEYGNKYVTTKEFKIGGRKGMIDLNTPYTSNWSLVDTENIFKFDDCKWSISDELEQYKVKNTYDETENFTNESEMERILCYKIGENYRFFDEKITEITNFIEKL